VAAVAFSVSAQPPKSPAETVEAFYAFHLEQPKIMYLCRESVKREGRWFTPRLRDLLSYELDRAAKAAAAHGGPDQYKPFVAGDVFTSSEDSADSFRVGVATITGDTAKVPVACLFTRGPVIEAPRKDVVVVVVLVDGAWLIDNVLYGDGSDLVDLLSRPDYDSYGT
jgi:hypothetical protein